MSETTKEAKKKGSWFCLHCKRPVEIEEVIKTPETYTLIANCPEKHEITLAIQSNGIAYLTHEEQKELAKVFLATTLSELESKHKEDILTINVKKAMAEISGLTEDECASIIRQGIEDRWVKETQPLILDRIAFGDKDILKKEVTIDDTKEPETK